MNLPELSLKRPVFIFCLVILSFSMGLIFFYKIPVNLFPEASYPIVSVTNEYPGASAEDVLLLVSKIYEEEFASMAAVKSLQTRAREGVSQVVVEFQLGSDMEMAMEEVRDRVLRAKSKLPSGALDAVIKRFNPFDRPILILALSEIESESKSEAQNDTELKLSQIANNKILPQLEQVDKVGLVEVLGLKEREVRIELDYELLKKYELSASSIVKRFSSVGQNIPLGTIKINPEQEMTYRAVGEFTTLSDVESALLSFAANERPIYVREVAQVVDGFKEQKALGVVNGKKAILFNVYRQSGANILQLVQNVRQKVERINADLKRSGGHAQLQVVRDRQKIIVANIDDVLESIVLGLILTILIVFIFLKNARSTFITAMALPNSLMGAFILIALAGFSINVMTLLAISISVGLLIDDAIVVRENIFRYFEMGMEPKEAALKGALDVQLAVVATSAAIIAVFLPIGLLEGTVGRFLREFGPTVCFIILISTFDALTVAPMLSAYFPGGRKKTEGEREQGQRFFVRWVEKVLSWAFSHRKLVLFFSAVLCVGGLYSSRFLSWTFLGPKDDAEFILKLEMPLGVALPQMKQLTHEIDQKLRFQKEIKSVVYTIGNGEGATNLAEFYVELVPRNERLVSTSEMKEKLRKELRPYSYARPLFLDDQFISTEEREFNLILTSDDFFKLQTSSEKIYTNLKNYSELRDLMLNRSPLREEWQVVLNDSLAQNYGVTSAQVGNELRIFLEGAISGKLRPKTEFGGEEYDIRVILKEGQRTEGQMPFYPVPNLNGRLVTMRDFALLKKGVAPVEMERLNQKTYYKISGDFRPGLYDAKKVIEDVEVLLKKENVQGLGVSYHFKGPLEDYQKLIDNMARAFILAVLFIYLVLASLYESFLVPVVIMLVLPFALVGAIAMLFLTDMPVDLYSFLGLLMLLGIAAKNSILLVDTARSIWPKQGSSSGVPLREALQRAVALRVRPILMTSMALVAGMLPVAIGLNEASSARRGLGIAVIGGVLSSTFLSLVIIPVVFLLIYDRGITKQ